MGFLAGLFHTWRVEAHYLLSLLLLLLLLMLVVLVVVVVVVSY